MEQPEQLLTASDLARRARLCVPTCLRRLAAARVEADFTASEGRTRLFRMSRAPELLAMLTQPPRPNL